ncbi:MAG: alkaline phosphatase family protein [Ignavibacteriae bacterium]|nr:MAG: alkaline phosphatase family protein [Ignavibacteriota bacterium]
MKTRTILVFLLFSAAVSFAQKNNYTILISFDGFRWDYTDRNLSPNLNEIAAEGVKALSLRPSFPSKTFPNHLSIITGMYPENHGIIANSFINTTTGEKYRIGKPKAVRNAEWYLGEAFWETAERNGIKTASYFWPGSEVTLDYRRPSLYKVYDHNKPYRERVDGVIEWLQLPVNERPKFITMYFHDTDSYGHKFGPNSNELNQSIQRLDTIVGYLNSKLDSIGLKDSTNLIFVSDHGMTEISTDKVINIEEMLQGFDYKLSGSKTVMMIEPRKNNFNEVLSTLKMNQKNYKVYLKEDMPEYFHYSENPFLYSIILVADMGWSLVNNLWYKNLVKNNSGGNHGFDNNHTDMHGIFIAKGPDFKKNYKCGTLWNIDIYPLLCKIFKIQPRSNIDGNSERIEFILNDSQEN